MIKLLNIEEILEAPTEEIKTDPYFKSVHYPKFMRRRVILPENYDKKKLVSQYLESRPDHKRKISNDSAYQKPFTAYGRVIEKVRSILDKNSSKRQLYDEALITQETFLHASPSERNKDYRYSVFPIEIQTNSKKTHRRYKSHNKITEDTPKNEEIKPQLMINSSAVVRRYQKLWGERSAAQQSLVGKKQRPHILINGIEFKPNSLPPEVKRSSIFTLTPREPVKKSCVKGNKVLLVSHSRHKSS